jgi:hypothetical protein
MSEGPASQADPLLAVLDALDRLGIRHHLGGSYASSVHGLPRQTRDADLVVDMDSQAVMPLAALLRSTFYLDEDRMRQAVARRSSVNLIHLATGFKIDLFIKGDRPFDESELARSRLADLPGVPGRQAPVKSAEDTVLRKLAWFSAGGGTSERQWLDVLGILKVQRGALDQEYLARWAEELGVRELLERAKREA